MLPFPSLPFPLPFYNPFCSIRHAEHIRTCILASSPSAIPSLTKQLALLKSKLTVDALEMHADAAATLKQADGLQRLISAGKAPRLGKIAPDLAMQALIVLAATHHARRGQASWRREEKLLIDQSLAALSSGQNKALPLHADADDRSPQPRTAQVSRVL